MAKPSKAFQMPVEDEDLTSAKSTEILYSCAFFSDHGLERVERLLIDPYGQVAFVLTIGGIDVFKRHDLLVMQRYHLD
jgi:hypothetical protein